MSIQKLWIDKIIEESRGSGKLPGLIFRYKNDPEIYTVMRFNDLCELIHDLKLAKEQLAIK